MRVNGSVVYYKYIALKEDLVVKLVPCRVNTGGIDTVKDIVPDHVSRAVVDVQTLVVSVVNGVALDRNVA